MQDSCHVEIVCGLVFISIEDFLCRAPGSASLETWRRFGDPAEYTPARLTVRVYEPLWSRWCQWDDLLVPVSLGTSIRLSTWTRAGRGGGRLPDGMPGARSFLRWPIWQPLRAAGWGRFGASPGGASSVSVPGWSTWAAPAVCMASRAWRKPSCYWSWISPATWAKFSRSRFG